MMIMIMKTPGSQVDSPAAAGKRRGGEREISKKACTFLLFFNLRVFIKECNKHDDDCFYYYKK